LSLYLASVVFPGLGWLQSGLLTLHRVEADDAEKGILAGPATVARAECGLEGLHTLGLIGFEQAGVLEEQQAGGREPQHQVGFGAVFLRQEPRSDHAGGVADPLDFDIGTAFSISVLKGPAGRSPARCRSSACLCAVAGAAATHEQALAALLSAISQT
jgi:hypothetical protein